MHTTHLVTGNPIRKAARDAFLDFTRPLEGCIEHLYLDVKGLPTIACGVLIATEATARALPLVHKDGTPATEDERAADWYRVKARRELAQQGARAAAAVAQLRLTPDGVEQVTWAKLELTVEALIRRFPAFGEWPASAQLAVVSLAWACGPAFAFPKCEAALRAQDWAGAAAECAINSKGNPGVVPRNRANRALLLGAAAGGDPDVIMGWP